MPDPDGRPLQGIPVGMAETLFHALTGLMSEFVYALDATGRLTYASDAAGLMFGWRPEELVGRHFSEFLTESSSGPGREAFEAAMSRREPSAGLVLALRRKDGSHLTGELHGSALVRDGVAVGTFGLIRDVTDRQAADLRVRESEERYRVVVSNTSEAIFVVQNGRFVFANDTCLRVTGLTEQEFLGLPITAVLRSDAHQRANERTRRLASGNLTTDTSEFPVMLPSGEQRLFQVRSVRVEWGGQPATLNFANDVTVARAAEKAMRDSEVSYRGLFNTIRQAIYIQDAQGRFLDVNDGALEMYGYSRDELLGQTPGFVAAPGMNDVEAVGRQIERAFAGEPQQFEFWGRRKNGELFPKDVRLYKGTYFGQDVLIAVAVDITDRKRTEEALRESEERYRVLFEGISDAVFVNEILADDEPGRFLQVNEVACRRLGYTRAELLNMTPRDITTPGGYADAAGMRRNLAEQRTALVETVHVTRDGRRLFVESNIRHFQYSGRTAALSISRDITDRKRAADDRLEMERRMLHVQKLESLGVLAGGIAHDFNNILVAVLGYADLAMSDLPPSSPVRASVDGIETAARRAADLCRQMLAYSGRGKFVIERIHLGELVSGMVHLVKASVSKRAILQLDVEAEVPPLEGDATQIRQVVMNLVTNASEALGEQGGVVSVRTSFVTCTQAELLEMVVAEAPQDGGYVCLEVSDTGCGMNADTVNRIFDPFYTTKFTGRGLGMAAVLGIVRGHKGAIDIRSEPGAGTTFRVLFPAAEGRTAQRLVPEPSDVPAPWRGQGCVLVADDEETVRGVARLMLERAGFEVLCAADGREALRVFQERRGSIALVLLDLTMPGLDGEGTLRALREVDSNVPVLMSSGFTEQEITARLAGQGVAGFVQKPYTLASLLSHVREAIEGN